MAKKTGSFADWARRATAGLTVGVSLLDGDALRTDYTVQLQIGHCLCTGKPLLVVVPEGTPIPDKLRLVANAIEYFDPESDDSLLAATTRALKRVGIHRKH